MGKSKERSDKCPEFRKRAKEKQGSKNEMRHNMSHEETLNLICELQARQLELDLQNEEIRLAQEKLIESRNRFSDLYDFAPVGYVTLNDKYIILEVNLTFADMLGVERSQLIKQPLSTFIVDADQDVFYLNCKQLLKEKGQSFYQLRMRKKGSLEFWASIESKLVESPGSSDVKFRLIISDITKRKKSEEEIMLKSAILTNLSEGAYVVRQSDGIIVYTNPKFVEIFGYEPGEMIGKHFSILYAPTGTLPEETERIIMAGIKKHGIWSGEILNVRKDGTTFWCAANVSEFTHPEHGKVLVSGYTDISERKTAETALAAKERYFREVLYALHEDIIVIDPDYRITDVNNSFLIKTKHKREEVIGRYCYEILHGNNKPCSESGEICKLLEVFETGKPCSYQHKHISVDKESINVDVSFSPVRDGDGNITHVAEAARDITGLFKMMEEVEALSKFPNENPSPVLRIDKKGKILYANSGSSRLLDTWGCSEGEYLPDDLALRISNVLAGGVNKQYEQKCDDITYALVFAPIMDSKYVNIYGLDITDSKKTKASLRKSEERLELALKAGNIGVWDWNIIKDEVIFGERWASMIGYKVAELKPSYKTWESLIHPDDKDEVMKSLNSHFENEKNEYNVEFRMKCKSGEWKWIKAIGKLAERDDNGAPLRMAGIHIDIDQQKKAVDEIKRQFDLNKLYLQTAGVMMVALDVEGRITLINPRGSDILEYQPQELVGKNWFDTCLPKHNVEEVRNVFGKLMTEQAESVQYYENTVVTKSGKERMLAFHNTVLRDASSNIIGLLSSGEDITERKQLEDQLRHSEKMQAIGHLAGGIAHDFNNQLTGIFGYADILNSKLNDVKLKEYVELIKSFAQRSSDLIEKLLAFARKGTLINIPINIHDIVHEVISILERSIDKRIKIKTELKAAPAVITGDPGQIQNALLNIAINARDAMGEKGVITFSTEIEQGKKSDSAGYIKLVIADTGEGMDEETQNRIFEPFFTTKEQGYGMGLAAVYGTVISHKGKINVHSRQGEGTTFDIYLPVSEAEIPRKKENNSSSKKHPAHGGAGILIVDDEEKILEMLSLSLEIADYKVYTANNGRDAINKYKKLRQSIDIVLLDMIMPEFSGKETFWELKALDPDIKVILSTGYSQEGGAQEILDAGAVGFVKKPFHIPELIDMFEKVLKR